MNNLSPNNEIWFVYDGECPLCKKAALALRIKQDYGTLHLLNAREAENNLLLHKINSLALDLDEGMVIYDGKKFYHGKDVLRFMAKYGDNKGLFNITNKVFFWSDFLAKIIYPWLRGIRNTLIKQKNVTKIDNLNLKATPIFKNIFASSWDELPTVIKKHYANRPYSSDITIAEGTLNVMCAGPIKWFAPLFWLMGGIPPRNEKNVLITVKFESNQHTKSFHFNRVFYFKYRKPYVFRSRMIQTRENEIIELMRRNATH